MSAFNAYSNSVICRFVIVALDERERAFALGSLEKNHWNAAHVELDKMLLLRRRRRDDDKTCNLPLD